jgi:hypothetical protein
VHAAALTNLEKAAAVSTIVAAGLSLLALLAALRTVGRAADASRSAEVTVRLSLLDRLVAVTNALRVLRMFQRSGSVGVDQHKQEIGDALGVLGALDLPASRAVLDKLESGDSSQYLDLAATEAAIVEVEAAAKAEREAVASLSPGRRRSWWQRLWCAYTAGPPSR